MRGLGYHLSPYFITSASIRLRVLFLTLPFLCFALPAADNNTITARDPRLNLVFSCHPWFGQPDADDCNAAELKLHTMAGSDITTNPRILDRFYQFVAIGQRPIYPEGRSYHTPLFFRSGQHKFFLCHYTVFPRLTPGINCLGGCNIALFMNEDTRRDRDTATLREILQAAKDLNSICVAGPGRIGGMVKYLGTNKAMNLYMYASSSTFAGLIALKLSCPNCGQQDCNASVDHYQDCSNNDQVIKNIEPSADPEYLSSLAIQNAALVSETEPGVCGGPCKSQADCSCSDYLCMEDMSMQMTTSCVFAVLSSHDT